MPYELQTAHNGGWTQHRQEYATEMEAIKAGRSTNRDWKVMQGDTIVARGQYIGAGVVMTEVTL